jgi:hypothetical protein
MSARECAPSLLHTIVLLKQRVDIFEKFWRIAVLAARVNRVVADDDEPVCYGGFECCFEPLELFCLVGFVCIIIVVIIDIDIFLLVVINKKGANNPKAKPTCQK